MRKKIHLIVLFLLIFNYVSSQPKKYNKIHSEDMWKNIALASSFEKPYSTDTSVILYTNRNFQPGIKKIFGDYIDTTKNTRIILAVCKNSKWKNFIMPDLDSAIRILSKRDLICYVEGMGKNFPLALERAAALSVQYQINVIMFDYPSINADYSLTKNFYYAQKSAAASASQYAGFLQLLQQYKLEKRAWISDINISMLFHSMGNIMLKEFIQKNNDKTLDQKIFKNLILNAACVNQKKHKVWIDKINFSERVYINYNKQDRQLNGAMIITLDKKLGAKISRPLSDIATYIDFNKLTGKLHSAFLEIPGRPSIPLSAYTYYNDLFHGKYIDTSDKSKFLKSKTGIGYIIK